MIGASSILLVEDDQDLRDLLAEFLAAYGHEVRQARDGIEALRELDVRFPQLVISDLDMPVLDGAALIHRMFVEDLGRENVPVILMSGNTQLPQIAEAAGTRYAIAKPFSIEELDALMERALTERLPPRPPGLTKVAPG